VRKKLIKRREDAPNTKTNKRSAYEVGSKGHRIESFAPVHNIRIIYGVLVFQPAERNNLSNPTSYKMSIISEAARETSHIMYQGLRERVWMVRLSQPSFAPRHGNNAKPIEPPALVSARILQMDTDDNDIVYNGLSGPN
jgi:hypothetical protein